MPELKAHAKGLPYLAYLLSASQEVPVLSSHGAFMVRVPVPERYAIHKLIVSQLRAKTSSKPEKDLRQAATLIEAVVERFPGAIEEAVKAVPKSALNHVERATEGLKAHLPRSAEAAWESLRSVPSSEGTSVDSPRRRSDGGNMQRYANLSGNSGVVAYEIGSDSITVKFEDGCRYLYTYQSAGADSVERMKALAASGRGLSGFISSTVRNDYARKFD